MFRQLASNFGKLIAYLGQKKNHTFKISCEENLFRQLVANYANFLGNNSIFMERNCAFKRYHQRGKFIINQSVRILLIYNKITYLHKKNLVFKKYNP